jgi:hypothetical protein
LKGLLTSPQALALCLTGYNPDPDGDGKGAEALIQLLADALAERS